VENLGATTDKSPRRRTERATTTKTMNGRKKIDHFKKELSPAGSGGQKNSPAEKCRRVAKRGSAEEGGLGIRENWIKIGKRKKRGVLKAEIPQAGTKGDHLHPHEGGVGAVNPN